MATIFCMPTYDYKCTACGHAFEQFQGINDPHLTDCPKCGKPALQRLIGAGAGLLFKGSGFYSTDHRSSCPAAEASGGGCGCGSPNCPHHHH